MAKFRESINNLFRHHKLKIFFFFGAIFVFFLLLFPTNDLADLVTNTVSEQTNKQVYLQFDELGFTLLPRPGIGLKNVYLESAMAPTLNIGSLTLAPSISSLLSFKQGLATVAEDFLGGDISASWREADETPKGDVQQKIDIELSNIGLQELLELIEAPVQLTGKINGETQATIDPSFTQQPNGEVEIKIQDFRFPAGPIPTPMGNFPLPEIKVSSVTLKGRLIDGELYIDQLQLGDSKDQINGQVKGKVRLKLVRRGVQVETQPGRFEFDVDIKVLPQMQKDLQLVLGLLDTYKRPGIGYANYCLKVSGRNFYGPPSMVPQDNCK